MVLDAVVHMVDMVDMAAAAVMVDIHTILDIQPTHSTTIHATNLQKYIFQNFMALL